MKLKININIKNILIAIKNKIVKLPSALLAIIKMPYLKLYLLLTILFTLIFIFFTFPYEMIVRNFISNFGTNIQRTITIGSMNIGIFTDSTFDDVNIVNNRTQSRISARTIFINLAVNPIKIVTEKIFAGNLQINGFQYNSERIKLNMNMNSNLDLQLSEQGGVSSGTIKIMAPDAEIDLNNFTMGQFAMGGFTITRNIKIAPLIFELGISGNTYTIANCNIESSDLIATITGFIEQGRAGGRVEVDIIVDANSEALADYKMFLGQYIDSENKIRIPVRGTPANPRIDVMRIPANRAVPTQPNED